MTMSSHRALGRGSRSLWCSPSSRVLSVFSHNDSAMCPPIAQRIRFLVRSSVVGLEPVVGMELRISCVERLCGGQVWLITSWAHIAVWGSGCEKSCLRMYISDELVVNLASGFPYLYLDRPYPPSIDTTPRPSAAHSSHRLSVS